MKRTKRVCAILLTVAMLLGIFPLQSNMASAYTPAHHVIRVGLNAYRSWPLTPNVHLENEGGLRLGTYNAAREFVPTVNTIFPSLTVTGSGSSLTVRNAVGTVIHTGSTAAIAPVSPAFTTTYTLPNASFGDHVRRSFDLFGGFRCTASAGNLTVVNYVALEDYIKGVVPYEVFPNWPMETLKAQAVTARTYAVANFGRFGSHSFDVTNTVVSQVYKGMHGTTERTNQAVRETAGQFVLHNGRPIDAVYHAAHGGATEDAANIWGWHIPYLRGLHAPHEQLPANIRWSRTLTPAEFHTHMRTRDPNFHLPDIVDITPVYTPLGNMLSVTFIASNGATQTYHREAARTRVNAGLHPLFNSQRFTIERNAVSQGTPIDVSHQFMPAEHCTEWEVLYDYCGGTELFAMAEAGLLPTHVASKTAMETLIAGGLTFTVTNFGFGHNVGMSQYGAMSLAQMGYTHDEIIRFYYQDVELTNHTPLSHFRDVALGAWYFDAIEYVRAHGLMLGTSHTMFSPRVPATRGMFVTILGRMAGISTDQFPAAGTYRDVAAGRFYTPYVEWASQHGIVTGIGDGTFRPNQPVTRQEMAVILHRYAAAMAITLEQDTTLPALHDINAVALWAREAVTALQQAGILQGTGDGRFEPLRNSDRASIASIIANFHRRYVVQ